MPITILDAGIAIPRLLTDTDDDELAEFANPCHDPDDGRFCETAGSSSTPNWPGILDAVDIRPGSFAETMKTAYAKKSFEEVKDLSLDYWRKSFMNSSNMRAYIEGRPMAPAFEDGDPWPKFAALTLKEALRTAPPTEADTWRLEAGSPSEGQTLDWSIKAVASERREAEGYRSSLLSQEATMYRIPKGTKAVYYPDGREAIVQGRFTVTSIQNGVAELAPADANTATTEFGTRTAEQFANPCHDPEDGRFCETHGPRSGTGTALLERPKRSKKVQPATKAKYSKIETTFQAIPADQLEGQAFVDALQTPPDTITPSSKGQDMLLKQVRHAQGFDTLPQVVDQATFDKIPGQAFYRGIGGPRGSNYSEDYRSGEHYAGHGVFANGDYFTTSSGTAKGYAEGYPSPSTIQAKLRPGARVISFEDISEVHDQARQQYVWPLRDNPATANQLLKAHRQYDDLGVFAAASGYDAIRVDSPKIGSEKYFIILNRGAVVVSEEDLPT